MLREFRPTLLAEEITITRLPGHGGPPQRRQAA
jgi:hypothetical protein